MLPEPNPCRFALTVSATRVMDGQTATRGQEKPMSSNTIESEATNPLAPDSRVRRTPETLTIVERRSLKTVLLGSQYFNFELPARLC